MKYIIMLLLFVFICPAQNENSNQKIDSLVKSRQITFLLTTPEDINNYIGQADSVKDDSDGGMLLKIYFYTNNIFVFSKFKDIPDTPFTLFMLLRDNKQVDIGRDRTIVLRNSEDLIKINKWEGLKNISLADLNLSELLNSFQNLSFYTNTIWPEDKNKLPPGFEPAKIMKNALSPGLGINSLHKEGINGNGINIAIIDQPLLQNHIEYKGKIAHYDNEGLENFDVQMHSAPITSIVAGNNCGVAPESKIYFFAVAMWKNSNQPYIQALKKISEFNKQADNRSKIRTISISAGNMPFNDNYEEYKKLVDQLENEGVFVITCDQKKFPYGTVSLNDGQNPDKFDSYSSGVWTTGKDLIKVPAINRTLANYQSEDSYIFDRYGGMSWAAPYISAVAALGLQINPDLTPDQIRNLLVETAEQTTVGKIINPVGFIKKIKSLK